MTPTDLGELARRQLADYDAHRPGRVFENPSFHPSLDEAYAVQFRVAALRAARGEAIAGYKIGCVGEPVQRQLGVDRPVFGHLFATELHGSGSVLDFSRFDGLAIEGELAVRMAEDIDSLSGLPADAAPLIGSVFPVIELHNHVFRGATQTAAELVANNAFHAGVVLPEAEAAPRGMPEIAVYRNGVLLGTAGGDAIPGGPLGSVLQIARHVLGRGGRIQRGQILLTGSPLPLYRVSPGDELRVRTSGAGEAITRIEGGQQNAPGSAGSGPREV